MSNSLPVALPKTMPTNRVVDLSGQISQKEIGLLDSYAGRVHYSPHVVLLPPTSKADNTQAIALQIAKNWNLEPNGFLLIINPGGNTAAVVAGVDLQSKGFTGKYINSHLIPNHFEKAYAQGNVYAAIRGTLGSVEHKLNQVALQTEQPAYQHHTHSDSPFGFLSILFFFICVLVVFIGARPSSSTRRMKLLSEDFHSESNLSADLERIHRLMGDGSDSASKQVPMKEFAQRANFNRNPQDSFDSLDALPPLEHESNFPHRSSTILHNYADEAAAAEKKKPLKLIFEGAHAGEKLAAPAEEEPKVKSTFAVPTLKPYEFPEDETVVPSVSSIQPASDVSIPDPDPDLISIPSTAPASVQPAPPIVASAPPTVFPAAAVTSAAEPADPDASQTTESVLKIDQFAQAMKSEKDEAADLQTWRPPAYTLPPAPVMPEAPTLPPSHFNSSFSNDFASILSSNSAAYGSEPAIQPSGEASTPGKQAATTGLCPQCQSEKSPDFSFCLRCGHMFV